MKSRPGQNKLLESTARGVARMAIAAVTMMGLACADSTGPVTFVQVVPAAPTVTLQKTQEGQVLNTSVTVTNTSSFTVVYSSCGVSLEKAPMPALPPGKSEWTHVWSMICALMDAAASQSSAASTSIGVGESVLKPGESVTIPVWAVVGQAPFPNFTGEPGSYRFHVPVSIRVLGIYPPASTENVVSEPFTLLQAP